VSTQTIGQLTATLSGSTFSTAAGFDGGATSVDSPWVFTYVATDSFGKVANGTVTLTQPANAAAACVTGGGGGNN
jgi:hypothetical protein